jgi:hypothetical protein
MNTLKTVLGLVAIGGIFANIATASENDKSIGYQKVYSIVQPIVKAMTLDQKLGQMVLPKYTFFMQDDGKLDYTMINRYALGAVLAAGGEIPDGKGGVDAGMDDDTAYLTATPENWRPLAENTNTHAPVITLESGSKLAIPLLVGIDAVHGMHEVLGNIVFPHNIGLSATHDPALLAQVGHVTAEQLLKQGLIGLTRPLLQSATTPIGEEVSKPWAVIRITLISWPMRWSADCSKTAAPIWVLMVSWRQSNISSATGPLTTASIKATRMSTISTVSSPSMRPATAARSMPTPHL